MIFALVCFLAIVAATVDAESTLRGLARGYKEGNPVARFLFGETPSRRSLYLVFAGQFAICGAISWYAHSNGHIAWPVPLACMIASHGYAAFRNYKLMGII